MVQINFGNLVTQNGRTTAAGLQTGLDSSQIIDAILEAKQIDVTEIEDDIAANLKKIDALNELKTKIQTFRDAANGLRNPPGVDNDADNFFNYRIASVTSTDSNDTQYVSVTPSPGALVTSHTISNITLAETHTLRKDSFTSKTASVVDDLSITNNYSISTSALQTTLSTATPVQFSNAVSSAGTQATINVVFSADNEFDAADSLTFGTSVLTFGAGGGDDLDISGAATLQDKLIVIVDHMNTKTTGAEAGYTYGITGGTTITVTRNVNGTNSSVTTNLDVASNFSSGSTNQTVAIGDIAATNGAAAGTVNGNGTDGTDDTLVTDALSGDITTLSGAITGIGATYNAGSGTATTFTANTVTLTATVGGETYTSNAITLQDGSVGTPSGGGNGDNGYGNRIPAGTTITFTKDSYSGTGTAITFQLVTGSSDITVNNSGEATSNLATPVQNHLTNDSVSISTTFSDPYFRQGTVTLGGQSFTLSQGDSLLDIQSKINALSSTSNVEADIVQVSSSSFSLLLKATASGTTNTISEYSGGSITFGNDSETFTEVQAAVDAAFTINGIAVTRSSNVVSDVIDNLTINLLKATATETSTVAISNDTTTTQNAIIDFLNGYNDLKTYFATETERDAEGNFEEDADLGDERIVRDITTEIISKLNRTVSGLTSSTAPNTIFNLGISFTDFAGDSDTVPVDNIFELDSTELGNKLKSQFDDVRRVFELDFTTNNPNLSFFSSSNSIALNSFKLDIDTSRTIGDQVRVLDATTSATLYNMDIDINSGLITGQNGTTLEDVKFIYIGSSGVTIDVTLTQGIADGIYNSLDTFLESTTGQIDAAIQNLQEKDDNLNEDLDQLNASIESERETLINRFSALEATIGRLNNVLTFLEAQRNALAAR